MFESREHFSVEDLTKKMRETICDCSEASQFLNRSESTLKGYRYKNIGPKWFKYYNGRVGYRIEDMVKWLHDKERQRCAAENQEYSDERMQEILMQAINRYSSGYSEKTYPMPKIWDRRAYSVHVQVEHWVNL